MSASPPIAFGRNLLRSVLALFVLVVVVNGQESANQYWYPVEPYRIEVDRNDAEVRMLLDRWERIGSELQNSSNSFAGTYRKDSYNGWILRWAPQAGFVYVNHSEGLSIIDFSYGSVEVTRGEIRFIPERPLKNVLSEEEGHRVLVWVPAQIQQLRYMIPKEEIQDFGQYVAGLSDYNDFNGACCEFDPFFNAPASAVAVPNEFNRFVKRPITGHINWIGKRRIVKDFGLTGNGNLFSANLGTMSLTPIAIDLDRIHGLKKNMLLRMMGEQFELPGQYIRVTSVNRRTANAVLIRRANESFPPIRRGMRVTTSPILNN